MFLRDRLTAGQRPLKPWIMVRVHVPQPDERRWGGTEFNRTKHRRTNVRRYWVQQSEAEILLCGTKKQTVKIKIFITTVIFSWFVLFFLIKSSYSTMNTLIDCECCSHEFCRRFLIRQPADQTLYSKIQILFLTGCPR